MKIISLQNKYKKVLMFAVLFLYAAGPVFRIFNAYLSDIFFSAVLVLLFLSGTRFYLKEKLSLIFLIPVVIVFLILAGKIISGFTPGIDEAANFLNYVKLYFLFAAVYSVFYNCSDEKSLKKDLEIFNGIIIFFLLFVCSIGILQFVQSPVADFIIKNFYHVVHKTGTDNIYEFELLNRVTSIFDSFNGMGIVLCFTLFILVFVNIQLKNYYSLLVLLFGIALIFLTGNRASLILFFLMSSVYFLYIKKGITLKGLSVGAVVVLLSGAIFFFVSDYLRFDNYIRFYEFKLFFQNGSLPPTLQVRLEKWQWLPVYIMSVKQSLFGYTTNDFIKDKMFTSPDNQYLNWLVYLGYVGACLFIIWAFYSLYAFIRNKKHINAAGDIFIKNSAVFFIIYWLGLILIGLFQESFFFVRLREIFIFILAMITAYRAILKEKKPSHPAAL